MCGIMQAAFVRSHGWAGRYKFTIKFRMQNTVGSNLFKNICK